MASAWMMWKGENKRFLRYNDPRSVINVNTAVVRFYGNLNHFLLPEQQYMSFSHSFNGQPSVKDLIESLGVPHTEVDLLLVDGESTGFAHQVRGGERIAAYPRFFTLDIAGETHVRPAPLHDYRFIADVHLGKLASYLRLFGFDTLYRNDNGDEELADASVDENRILLTFDRQLLMRKKVTHGYLVRSRNPEVQLVEVLTRFNLADKCHPFQRCMACNGVLGQVPREEVLSSLPENIRETLDAFHQCPGCGRVYWRGTHYEHMKVFVRQVKDQIQMNREEPEA
jgi:uncharacterized protein